MSVYRTPDERFENLPGYAFAPHYTEHDRMRMHRVDEGSGRPFLLLHGEPSWSYLYRKMITVLAAKHRAVAPDYFGFGRSDKPEDIGWYSYDRHVESITALVEQLDLRGMVVVVQDWGGPIGLRVATEMRERVAGLVIMNTGLFTPSRSWPTEGFMQWRNFAERVGLDMPIGRIIDGATSSALDEPVIAAYEAPWPVRESKAGVAAFPLLVPIDAGDPAAASMRRVASELSEMPVPSLVAWSDSDPVFPPQVGKAFARRLRGPVTEKQVVGASHFLQEDAGPQIADWIMEWTTTLS